MSKKKHTILLIEDDLFIWELYEHVFLKAGFAVLVAADGIAGLELAYKKPDLILLDIMMPRLNGIEVLKKLKRDKKTKAIPIVLLTNLGQESIIKEALRIGAHDYIMKMRFTPYEIVNRVKDYFAHPNRKLDYQTLGLD